MAIAIADQSSKSHGNRVAAGYTSETREGVAIYVQRGDRFGQMLLTEDEAKDLLYQLSVTLGEFHSTSETRC